MRTLTIPITMIAKDVSTGIRGNPCECPFAKAIERALAPLQVCRWEQKLDDVSKKWWVDVGICQTRIVTFHGLCIGYIKHTPSMARWIQKYDIPNQMDPNSGYGSRPHEEVTITLELTEVEGLTL